MIVGERVFEYKRVWQVTPEALAEVTERLAEAARLALGPISAVAGIARGGLAPARRMAAALEVPLTEVSASHNLTDALYAPATGEVAFDMADVLTLLRSGALAGTILVVDDICGTGATLRALLDAIASMAPGASVGTITLCRNVGAEVEPDLWCWDVADWVVFPWEPQTDGHRPVPLPWPTELKARG